MTNINTQSFSSFMAQAHQLLQNDDIGVRNALQDAGLNMSNVNTLSDLSEAIESEESYTTFIDALSSTQGLSSDLKSAVDAFSAFDSNRLSDYRSTLGTEVSSQPVSVKTGAQASNIFNILLGQLSNVSASQESSDDVKSKAGEFFKSLAGLLKNIGKESGALSDSQIADIEQTLNQVQSFLAMNASDVDLTSASEQLHEASQNTAIANNTTGDSSISSSTSGTTAAEQFNASAAKATGDLQKGYAQVQSRIQSKSDRILELTAKAERTPEENAELQKLNMSLKEDQAMLEMLMNLLKSIIETYGQILKSVSR